MSGDGALAARIDDALDGLLAALALVPVGGDRFQAPGEPGRFARAFGGQLLAQALVATGSTVHGRAPASLHATFVDAGLPGHPVEVDVERVRDGRTTATRGAEVVQDGRTLLCAIVTFHDNPAAPHVEPAPLDEPLGAPDDVATLQDWVEGRPEVVRESAATWIDRPPPIEMRLDEPPSFVGEPSTRLARSHWMRLPRDVGEDPLLHAGLLVYASDFLLLDMAFRHHPARTDPASVAGTSLDHTVWLHGPVRFDRWHRATQELTVLSGHRALVRGAIRDRDGRLVASVAQEVLVRPAGREGTT